MKKLISLFLFISFSANSATLKEVIQYALKNAPQFQEEMYSTSASLESLKKVFAIYDTQMNLSSSYDKSLNSLNYQNETTHSSSLALSKNVGAGINLEVKSSLNSRKSISSYKYQSALEVNANISLLKNLIGQVDRTSILIQEQDQRLIKNALKRARESFIYGIISAYIDLIRLEQLLKENENLNKSISSLVNATKKKRSIGAADSRSVLQMEAKLLNSNMNIMDLKRLLLDSQQNLRTLTGGGTFSNFSWPQVIKGGSSKQLNLTLKSLAIEKEKIKLQIKKYQWNRLPDLKLRLSYQYGELDDQEYSYNFEKFGEGVGLYLNFPLGNSSAQADYNSSKLSLLANEYAYKKELDSFHQQVQEHERAVNNYQQQISIAHEIIELQQERYSQEIRAYNQGRSGINDINTAQNDLINAQISHIEKISLLHQFTYGKKYLHGSLESLFSN